MKKIDFKTRMQWGWFKAAFFGIAIAMLITPTAGALLDDTGSEQEKEENPILSMFSSISFGPKTKVMINGDIVALAKSEEAARQAYKEARLAYNANGVQILDVDVTYAEVDKEQDAAAVDGMKVLREEKLSSAILESFDRYAEQNKSLAYTMRIDDYTVTVESMADLITVLEQAQGQYDVEDTFKVGLRLPASRNVTMYEVDVVQKVAAESGAEAGNVTEGSSEVSGTEAGELETGASEADASGEETEPVDADVAAQSVNDGIKYVGFSETIQVMETYVSKEQITDKETAYSELTTKNDEASIYVVQPGDSLSVIAENNNMSIEQIKELNPGIESDDNIYYDDRLNITVPKAAVQILVQKQETYKEDFYADTVYEDDSDMFIGETEVVQEGQSGTHTVTDLVTYKDDMEYEREQLQETVQVAAVAQIVRRGTKSKPTYMYPCTNWPITSNYGYRWGRLHAGTDVGVPTGTTVRASRAGQVTVAGWVGGYGYCVMIDHGDGITTVYGHLSEVTVSVGQYVDQGQQIALSGNTGRSTGPHLHFEIRVNGSAVDAMPYLTGANS